MWRIGWHDLKRPLNKCQGHSFWYQSISHTRLPISLDRLSIVTLALHTLQATDGRRRTQLASRDHSIQSVKTNEPHRRSYTLWGIKNCTLLTGTITLQNYAALWWLIFWHIDAHENILSPACLTVFVESKTENQLIRFVIGVIAYLVADNNVKCETAAATRDRRLHHSRPMAS